MSRRNSDRIGGRRESNATPPVNAAPPEGFSFVVPTEFVELPSGGIFYPEEHPLHGKDTIEIRHMTAKEEDILTSRTLLQKGIALDRLINNIVVDKRIVSDNLLVGDRNAIVLAARISGYGPEYMTKVTCPMCATEQRFSFDVSEPHLHYGGEFEDEKLKAISKGDGFFEVQLPVTKFSVEFKLLTGAEEKEYLSGLETNRKNRKEEKSVTSQLMAMLHKVNGTELMEHKKYVVDNLPSRDSKYLRDAYRRVSPSVELLRDFECEKCGHESRMEVPLSADFFWPQS